jgi:hypothetical protein
VAAIRRNRNQQSQTDAPEGEAVGRSIRLVVVALVMALAVAACGGKQEEAPQAAGPNASSPQVVDDDTLAAGEVDFKVADVRSSQMLLATKADGKHMPVDRSGPIRIVFPDSSSMGRNPDLWIWSVASMKVA